MKLFKSCFCRFFWRFWSCPRQCFYLLYESKAAGGGEYQHYEKLSFQEKQENWPQKLRGMYETEEQEIQDRIVASAFRQYVGSQGILYRGTKELFNVSPYEYEVGDIFKKRGEMLLLKSGERRLLLFCDTLTFGKNYRAIYYKDIKSISTLSGFFTRGFFLRWGAAAQ